MVEEKTISTRGLKADACLFGELIFDVNSAFFHNHGGYEHTKKFYAEACQTAVDIVGREQYILSVVMDEHNRAIGVSQEPDAFAMRPCADLDVVVNVNVDECTVAVCCATM